SRSQRIGRDLRTRLILKNSYDLVVSSKDVLDDFNRFYSLRKELNVYIYHFVSIIDDFEKTGISKLRAKYQLPDKYFMVSNQFHKHKNHRAVLLALARLKEKGVRKHVAFTGKFPSASDSPYLAELHQIIGENQLQDQITMLGIISRADQLQLMRHSQAVIQPSLFEGWSTVIEDARSLQVPVLAANLKVNMEQLGPDEVYFDPHNTDELASLMEKYRERNLNDKLYEDYSVRVKNAAKTLLKIFS
ncbi:MAG: glycosyltransferase, partial [Bacteroidales bacterium]